MVSAVHECKLVIRCRTSSGPCLTLIRVLSRAVYEARDEARRECIIRDTTRARFGNRTATSHDSGSKQITRDGSCGDILTILHGQPLVANHSCSFPSGSSATARTTMAAARPGRLVPNGQQTCDPADVFAVRIGTDPPAVALPVTEGQEGYAAALAAASKHPLIRKHPFTMAGSWSPRCRARILWTK